MNLPSHSASYRMLVAVLALGMAATVGTALAFEHIGGFIPCKLCLGQRTPYYMAVPIAVLALVVSYVTSQRLLSRGLVGLVASLMLYSIYLATFHAGVEWGWWPGPTDCAAAVDASVTSAGDLLAAIDATRPPSCDKAAGRFLGLSFAGWNVLASLLWAGLALFVVFRGRQ